MTPELRKKVYEFKGQMRAVDVAVKTGVKLSSVYYIWRVGPDVLRGGRKPYQKKEVPQESRVVVLSDLWLEKTIERMEKMDNRDKELLEIIATIPALLRELLEYRRRR